MKKLLVYLNPVLRFGTKKYSLYFPLLVNIGIIILSECYAYGIAHNPEIVGNYIIFLNAACIIYFSLRDGIKGGLITTIATVVYYFYIIYTREYRGDKLIAAIDASAMLAIIYVLLTTTIGYLKQRIDVLIIREIDARRIAEEGKMRLQTILQQLPVGVLMVDIIDKKIEGNKQIEKTLGHKIQGTLETDPKYRSPFAYQNNEQLLAKNWPIIRALEKGEIVNNEEMEFKKNNEQKIVLKVSASPIKNRNNQVIAAVSTLNDITRERDLENRKDDFINMASHELKTPVTSMKIYIEILLNQLKKSQDTKSLKTVQSIKSQTDRLQELISDLLDVSRIQTGKLNFNKEKFVINDLIAESVEILQTTTHSHHISFKKSPKITVFADRFRIYQVLTNLITNAIKYSPDNTEIKLKITTEKNKVIVSVQDSGIGIAKDEQKKIFERLYQVTEPKEKTFPGLGMGLYISHEIIKRHKGQIWVEGEKGKGSTFFFSLPQVKMI